MFPAPEQSSGGGLCRWRQSPPDRPPDETGDLLVTLFSDGVALDRAGTNSVKRFQFIPGFKQSLTFLDGLFALNDIVELIELVFIECEGDAELANTAILAMDCTSARLNASYNSLFRDHRSAQAVIDFSQFYHLFLERVSLAKRQFSRIKTGIRNDETGSKPSY
jgi:hypothetical protein